MGLFRKGLATLFGTSEAKLIKLKRNASYKFDRWIYKNEADALEDMVKERYTLSIQKMIQQLDQEVCHHAELSNEEHVKASSFLDRFVDYYCLEIFTKGVSLGYAIANNTADRQFQEEVGILVHDINQKMLTEAKSYFSERDAECFTNAANLAYELGIETGKSFFIQGYIMIHR